MLTVCCILLAVLLDVSLARDLYIVGGKEVYPPGTYPYQAALYNLNSFYCGSVLISPRHVLTAAHCIDANIAPFRVILGAHDRETGLDGQQETYTLSAAVQHPNWTNVGALGFPNDIAVLTLSTEANIAGNPYIDSAILPPEGDEAAVDFVGKYCNIIGWGQTSGTGQPANVLREATIDIITNAECAARWNDAQIRDGHICIFDSSAQLEGACYGDSGGALVCQEGNDWVVAGLTSWIYSGCNTNYPSVYTRVSYYRSWVESVIQGDAKLFNWF